MDGQLTLLGCENAQLSQLRFPGILHPEGRMSSLQRRIEQLEQRSPAESNQLNVEMGYIQHMPPEYQEPRHLVVRDRLSWNGLGGCL